MEQVLPNIFRLEAPLPGNPLRAVNVYIIRDKTRSLIIDPGLNHPKSMGCLEAGLNELGVDRERADVFLTHMHIDHSGLASAIAGSESKIWIGEEDLAFFHFWKGWDMVLPLSEKHGIPVEELKRAIVTEEIFKQDVPLSDKLTPIPASMRLHAGGYNLECVKTPGHTRGHTCLYEPESATLLSGDHILPDITPIITGWDEHLPDPLGDYLNSLKMVRGMGVKLVLPGHRGQITDHVKRIDEILAKHEARLNETQLILNDGPFTAYRIASMMSWDFKGGLWEAWPLFQRWFATGEALSHVRRLIVLDKAAKETDGLGRTVFRAV